MCELLGSLRMRSVWDRGSFNYAYNNFKKFPKIRSENLAREDILATERSKTMPHYADFVKGDFGKKFYLENKLPSHHVTAITQLRLGRNQILIGREWINLGEFKVVQCKYCGDILSLLQVLYNCPNTQKYRESFVSHCLAITTTLPREPELLANEICNKLYPAEIYKALHIFVSSCAKSYGSNNR